MRATRLLAWLANGVSELAHSFEAEAVSSLVLASVILICEHLAEKCASESKIVAMSPECANCLQTCAKTEVQNHLALTACMLRSQNMGNPRSNITKAAPNTDVLQAACCIDCCGAPFYTSAQSNAHNQALVGSRAGCTQLTMPDRNSPRHVHWIAAHTGGW